MKKFKSIACLLLSICLLFCTLPLAKAESEEQADYPIIWMAGAFHELYYNAGTPEQTHCFGGNSGFSTKILTELSGAGDLFTGYLKQLNFKAIAETLADYVNQLFEPIVFNPDGTSAKQVDGNQNHNRWELENPDGQYHFDYDWRHDPMLSAEKLHLYIQKVKQAETAEKVYVSVQSGSGPVGLAYLKLYLDQGDLAGMFFTASLHKGSSVFGDLVTKNFSINAEALANTNLLEEWDIQSEAIDKIWPTLQGLNQYGLLAPVTGAISMFLRATVIGRLYTKAIIPSVLTMPVFWSYVPVEYYAKGIEACFGKERGKYAGLIAKLDKFHYTVAKNADTILKDAAKVARIGLMSFSGTPQFPLGPKSNQQGDPLVGAAHSSSGATVSQVGKTLKDKLFCTTSYAQKVQDGHNHLSPDYTVDASTCVLPETTWFIHGMEHFDAGNNTLRDMVYWFFKSKEAPNVFTDTERYPQFIWRKKVINSENGRYHYEDTVPPTEETVGRNQRALNVLAKIVKQMMYVLFWWLK